MSNTEQQQTDLCLKTLEIKSGSSWIDIEKQYRVLVQIWHPDRYSGEDNTYAHDRFIEINSAFNKLRDDYRKTGKTPLSSVAKPIPNKSASGSHVLTGAQFSSNSTSTVANRNHILKVAALFVGLTLLVTLFWVLDKQLAENNRERALILKTNNSSTNNPSEIEISLSKISAPHPFELINADNSM
jgi:hypothetical protein